MLLTHAASAAASSYRFDMALRVAGTREVAAVVLSAGHAESVTSTSSAIAHRAGIAILATAADVEPDNPDDLLLLQLACRARELV